MSLHVQAAGPALGTRACMMLTAAGACPRCVSAHPKTHTSQRLLVLGSGDFSPHRFAPTLGGSIPPWDRPCGRLASSLELQCHWKLASLRLVRRGKTVIFHLLLSSRGSGLRKQLLGVSSFGGVLSSPFALRPGCYRLPTFFSQTT